MEPLEKEQFVIGEEVSLIIRPETKAQIHVMGHDTDGRVLYWVTYIDGDDCIKRGKFYNFELQR